MPLHSWRILDGVVSFPHDRHRKDITTLGPIIKQAIDAAVAPLKIELRDVKEELRDVKANFCYKGVWKTDEIYKVSNSVTDGGQIFIAMRNSQGQRPGFSDHWRLAVRKGQDGKDAR
jgi:hypothetical protein